MSVPTETLWPIQPHTQVKHAILRRYLEAWLPIMARYNGRIVFIDGFAGPGRYSGGEPGSPVIAVKTLLEHELFQTPRHGREVVFVFIEKEPDRFAALKQELKALGPVPTWVRIKPYEGEFTDHMGKLLDEAKSGGIQLAPTFAFIDPFGFAGVPLSLIARIVRNPHCECLITFMYEAITRWLSRPEPAQQNNYDTLFGTKEWRNLLTIKDPDERRSRIIDLYRQQLHSVAELKYVRTFEMINEGNRTEYFLYFGTNSMKGLSEMKRAMWKTDPMGGQVFSDRSDPAQGVLLQTGGETGLRETLQQHFRGKGPVQIDEIERFVLEETAYSEASHLKKKTLKLMEQTSPPTIAVRRPAGSRNRAGEYPEGTLVRFV